MKQVFMRIPQRAFVLVIGLLLSVGAFAQITVNGNVKDATGEAVIGATVRIIGQDGGTVTDFEGNFVIKCEEGADLQISSVGYQTVTVKAKPTVAVVLQDDAALLNEVVVIVYGVAKKNDLTGSVTAIKPDEKNHGLVTNAQDMIQGKIAGVNVTTGSGSPGTGATIRIRGGSSLNASNDPLIVIDGLAMDNKGVKGLSNPLSMVNPNDIESFTVLKDASATAIYGSRGSNGVIIITTKKGRGNQAPRVSYNGNVSYSVAAKKFDLLNAAEYSDFIKSYYGEDSDAVKLLGNADTDWQDEIYRGAVSTDHNVTLTGGLKNMPYRVSVGYTDQNGILKTSNFQRTTASVTLNPSFLDDHLKFNINGKFMYAHNRYANTDAIAEAVRMDPTQPVYGDIFFPLDIKQPAGMTDLEWAAYKSSAVEQMRNNNHGYFMWAGDGSALGNSDYLLTQNSKAAKNPVALLNEKDDRANSYDYIGNVEVDYAVHGLEDLHIHMNFSGDWANGKQNTDYADWGPSKFYYGNTGFTKENKYNLTYSAYAQYLKDFLETQSINVMAGYEWSHAKNWGNSLYYDPRTSTPETAGYDYSKSIWKTENYLVSFFGRLTYSAWDRYMLTATVRRDGSSRFREHWATFPSVALGWKINEEAFLKDVKEIDELKLRLGWGQTGQQEDIGDYKYFAAYDVNSNNTDGRYPINGVNNDGLLYRPQAYNKDLKWETTTTWNVGLDVSLFRNRVSAAVDAYYRKTTDLINTASVSAGSNFRNQVTSNIGTLENKGIEASLTVRPIVTNDFTWEVTGNFTYNKNEITELTGESSRVKAGDGGISAGTGNTVKYHSVGYPAGSFFVYQQVYDEAGNPLEGVYVDRNGDGQISESDKYFYKSPAAPYTAGLAMKFLYKNWDLGFNLRASFDNYVFNDRQASYVNVSKRFDSSFNYLQNVTAQAVKDNWCTYDHVLSDRFVQNASFLKCDNIALGYSFDNLFKSNSYNGLSGRVYVSATNVFTITNYDGLDPEVGSGIDSNMYPRPFTMLMGVSLNF